MTKDKKTCFIITPIGDNNSDIRRHIDGIIDQAIIPAIGDKYEITVAHRKYEIGSINDRVIKSVYESDLVIANLTTTNPNVMFELAIRYSFGKPAIVIAEEGTKLPFDVIEENTAFYINDPAGAAELKNKIREFESNINFDKSNYGPVQKVIKKIPLINDVESGETVPIEKQMEYIISRLDSIENNSKPAFKHGITFPQYQVEVVFDSMEKETPISQEHINSIFFSCGISFWIVEDDLPFFKKYIINLSGNKYTELQKKVKDFAEANEIQYSYKQLQIIF